VHFDGVDLHAKACAFRSVPGYGPEVDTSSPLVLPGSAPAGTPAAGSSGRLHPGVHLRVTTPAPTMLTVAHMTKLDTPAIFVHELTKTFRSGVEAVKGVDFDVAPGEVFGLLGPNGAGKSTTVGMLTTTITPTSGHARVAGFDVSTQPIAARRVSAVVFQDSVLDRPLTGRRNLGVHARLWGLDPAEAADRIGGVVEAFGLGALIDRPVDTYSGGQRRRLEIARALVSDPQVLFLDEPTVGLDPRIRFELIDYIAGLRARLGMTVLLTTHYLDEAEQLCDRVAIMHQGRIVALDSPAALLAGLGGEVVELRIDGDVTTAVTSLRAAGIAGDDSFIVGATVHIPVRNGEGRSGRDVVAAITDLGLAASVITSRAPTLDDVYLQLTGVPLAA
jgi:ABC-2 type transport system ATP-binding protein